MDLVLRPELGGLPGDRCIQRCSTVQFVSVYPSALKNAALKRPTGCEVDSR
jgi:hypothetical protein